MNAATVVQSSAEPDRSIRDAFEQYVLSHAPDLRRLYRLDPGAQISVRLSSELSTPSVSASGGLSVQVSESVARTVLSTSDGFRWGNGLVLVPTMYALMNRGVIAPRSTSARLHETVSRLLGPGHERNLGSLWAALRLVGLAGWVRLEDRDSRTSYALTEEGENIAELMKDTWGSLGKLVASLPRAEHYPRLLRDKSSQGDEAAAEYRNLVAIARDHWGLPKVDGVVRSRARSHLLGYLDGTLLCTAMVAMGMPVYSEMDGTIGVVAPPVFAAFAGDNEVKAEYLSEFCNTAFVEAALELLASHQIVRRVKGGAFTLTDRGRTTIDVAPPFCALPFSYLRTYAVLDEVLFAKKDPLSIESDTHVDRVINVFGSSGAGRPLVRTMCDQVLRQLFDRRPLHEQPCGLADMGCGDGRALRALAEYVVRYTERGKHLDEYPLYVIGADYNEKPRARARDTLKAFESIPGVRTAVVHADITDPDAYDETIRELGFRVRGEGGAEYRALELGDLAHTFMFLVHNRRLTVRHEGEARRILRERIRMVGKDVIAKTIVASRVEGLDVPEGDDEFLEFVIGHFRTSFTDDQGLVPGFVVGADLVEFLGRWARHARQGFVAVEAHSPWSNEMLEDPPPSDEKWMRSEKLPHVLNWGMHAFSRQYMLPYTEYRIALALAGVQPAGGSVHGAIFDDSVPSIDLLDSYRFVSITAYTW